MSRDVEIQNSVSNNPEDANFRLTEVITSEVSLVDAAANGRKFLIIKRKEVMNKKDQNILKSTEGAPAAAATEVTKTETPATETTPTETAPKAEAAPAGLATLSEGQELSSSIEGVEKAVLAIEKKFVEIKKSIPEDSKFMFEMMANAMSGMCMSMNAIAHDLTAFLLSDGKTTFGGQPVEKSVGSKEEVEKAGKKMASERLSKLKEAFTTLETLIKELDPDTTSEVTKGEQAMSTKTETVVAKAETSEVKSEEVKSEAAPATEAKVEKKEEATASPDISKIVTEAVEKAVKPLQEKIAKLEAEPVAPKAEETAGTEEVQKSAAGKKTSIFKGVL